MAVAFLHTEPGLIPPVVLKPSVVGCTLTVTTDLASVSSAFGVSPIFATISFTSLEPSSGNTTFTGPGEVEVLGVADGPKSHLKVSGNPDDTLVKITVSPTHGMALSTLNLAANGA